jgi:hypothetical protein
MHFRIARTVKASAAVTNKKTVLSPQDGYNAINWRISISKVINGLWVLTVHPGRIGLFEVSSSSYEERFEEGEVLGRSGLDFIC